MLSSSQDSDSFTTGTAKGTCLSKAKYETICNNIIVKVYAFLSYHKVMTVAAQAISLLSDIVD